MSPAFWVPQGARPIPIYMEACAADPTVFLFEFFFLQHISLTPLLSASYLSLKSRWCFPCSFCFPSAWFCASCDILWSHLGCLSVTCNLPASSNDSFRNLHIIVPIFLKRLEHVIHTSSGSLLSYDIPGTALAAVDITASRDSSVETRWESHPLRKGCETAAPGPAAKPRCLQLQGRSAVPGRAPQELQKGAL